MVNTALRVRKTIAHYSVGIFELRLGEITLFEASSVMQ